LWLDRDGDLYRSDTCIEHRQIYERGKS